MAQRQMILLKCCLSKTLTRGCSIVLNFAGPLSIVPNREGARQMGSSQARGQRQTPPPPQQCRSNANSDDAEKERGKEGVGVRLEMGAKNSHIIIGDASNRRTDGGGPEEG